MGSLFSAVGLALATLRSVAGVSVAYASGSNGPITFNATVGSTIAQIAADEATLLWDKGRDYLVGVTDLNFGSGPVEPQEGDTITEVDATTGKTYVFAVLPLHGQPCWRWSDPGRTQLRIHTKLKAIN